MSEKSEERAGRPAVTDEELRALVAQAAEAVRRGAEREPGRWDKFWERLPHVSTFVGSVVLGVVALMFNANYNEQQKRDADAQAAREERERRTQSEFERQKFVAEERERQRRIILELSDKILSDRPPEREGGQALLSHFYPGEAPHILRDLTRADPDEDLRAAVIAAAERFAAEAGRWGVVFAHAPDAPAAQEEQRRAQSLGFSVALYRKGGRDHLIAVADGSAADGPFNSVSDAEAARYTIRSQVRDSAYVVGLHNWCRDPRPHGSYVQCANE